MSGHSIWVFHRGALGDCILLWPLLRALRAKTPAVTLVTDSSKAQLAQQELGVLGVSVERARFNDLFLPGAAKIPGRIMPVGGVSRVISFLPVQGVERTWRDNAQAMFPGAAIELVEKQLDRALAVSLAEREGAAHAGGVSPSKRQSEAPIVLHVGAGGRTKRWPMPQWERLRAALAPRGHVTTLAGEVEAEQFRSAERAIFERMGGEFVSDLPALAKLLRGARLAIVADSGPAHLAAQCGIPTLALFGPTLAERWSPIGPSVRVLAPPVPSAMEWLTYETVTREAESMLESF